MRGRGTARMRTARPMRAATARMARQRTLCAIRPCARPACNQYFLLAMCERPNRQKNGLRKTKCLVQVFSLRFQEFVVQLLLLRSLPHKVPTRSPSPPPASFGYGPSLGPPPPELARPSAALDDGAIATPPSLPSIRRGDHRCDPRATLDAASFALRFALLCERNGRRRGDAIRSTPRSHGDDNASLRGAPSTTAPRSRIRLFVRLAVPRTNLPAVDR